VPKSVPWVKNVRVSQNDQNIMKHQKTPFGQKCTNWSNFDQWSKNVPGSQNDQNIMKHQKNTFGQKMYFLTSGQILTS